MAEHFDTSASKVGTRHPPRHRSGVDTRQNRNINALFGFIVYNKNEKPTNGEFIALVADKLAMEQIA